METHKIDTLQHGGTVIRWKPINRYHTTWRNSDQMETHKIDTLQHGGTVIRWKPIK